MTRTKWMRLGVNDPADILRWAATQNTRQLDEFRHRVIRGREFVSFRLIPRYRVEIGTCDIVVMAHVRASARQRLAATIAALCRRTARRLAATIEALRPQVAPPPRSAELYALVPARISSRSTR
ncbi:MAG TPA: hypothetical protein VNV38_02055 [Stellaceae bacterium]|jgi:hypothetical protein|nr:hypothetical protein [Stellaceae bacterium]